jgi:hypothetical protein
MFKDRENPDIFEATIGTVLSPPPKLRISIWDGETILESEHLYLNDRLFDDYTRQYMLTGEVTEYSFENTTNTEVASNHSHPIKNLAGNGSYEASGTFINTDTLKAGDLVKLTPTENGQKWFVDYKVRTGNLGVKK